MSRILSHNYEAHQAKLNQAARDFFPHDHFPETSRPKVGQRVVVLDVETTGLNPEGGDRIVQMCVADATPFLTRKSADVHTLEAKLNPEMPIPREATKIHGIRDKDVANAPFFADEIDQFLDFIGDAIVVGHNVSFDLRFLNAELARMGRDPIRPVTFCTLQESREAFSLPNYRLATVAGFVGHKIRRAHNAVDDALATVAVFSALMQLSDWDNEIKESGLSFWNLVSIAFVIYAAGSLLMWAL